MAAKRPCDRPAADHPHPWSNGELAFEDGGDRWRLTPPLALVTEIAAQPPPRVAAFTSDGDRTTHR